MPRVPLRLVLRAVRARRADVFPAPGFVSYDYEDLNTEGYVPGSEPLYLIIEGTDFTSETEVLFRGDLLTENPNLTDPSSPDGLVDPATLNSAPVADGGDSQSYYVLDENTIIVYLDTFIGDPSIIISTPPNDQLTNGTDGGDISTPPLDEIIPVDVVVKPVNVTRLYGQPNPDFEYAIFKPGDALIEVTPENVATLYPNNLDILDLFFDAPADPADRRDGQRARARDACRWRPG